MMQPLHVDCRGLTLAEAEAKYRQQANIAHDAWLVEYERTMFARGIDGDALAVMVADCRAEFRRLRDTAIEEMRAMAARGGKDLQ